MHHSLSGTGSMKGKAGEEQGSEGTQPCWAQAQLWFQLFICWHCPELTRGTGAKFQSVKWKWAASALCRNTEWLDKTAEFSENYRVKVEKLKFGLEHQSQQQLYIMWLSDVMPWSTNKCIFTSRESQIFFRKCPKNLNVDVQTHNCFQQTYFPGELPSFLLQQISSTWLPSYAQSDLLDRLYFFPSSGECQFLSKIK